MEAQFRSKGERVGDGYLYQNYLAALARIAELEATQPLPDFDGASFADTYHEMGLSGRLS